MKLSETMAQIEAHIAKLEQPESTEATLQEAIALYRGLADVEDGLSDLQSELKAKAAEILEETLMKNKLISIGFLGTKKVYLNLTRDEAIKRYLVENPNLADLISEKPGFVQEFEFNDEFEAYDVWN